MALKGILGHNGTSPVLNYAGTKPVVMTSPCPYSQWDFKSSTQTGGVWSASGSGANGSIRLTNDQASYNGSGIYRRKMLSKGYGTISATLTKQGSFTEWYARVMTEINGNVIDDVIWVNTLSGPLTLPVPYYRYVLAVYLQVGTGSGNYLNIAFTLS